MPYGAATMMLLAMRPCGSRTRTVIGPRPGGTKRLYGWPVRRVTPPRVSSNVGVRLYVEIAALRLP